MSLISTEEESDTRVSKLIKLAAARLMAGCGCGHRTPIDYQYGTWWRCRNCGAWVEKKNG